ncbi:MAG: hypothetical protein MJK07_16365 [Flavobacteriales bacterium]|nr:hypothetical protein [Flavobacteriales bacterium]
MKEKQNRTMMNINLLKVITLSLVIFFLGCKQNTLELKDSKVSIHEKEIVEKVPEFDFIQFSFPRNIIGKWNLCQYYSDDTRINYNVCWKVSFDKDGKGVFKKPSNEGGEFLWGIKGDSLHFGFTSNTVQELFFTKNSTFVYQYDSLSKKDRVSLELCLNGKCYKMFKQ